MNEKSSLPSPEALAQNPVVGPAPELQATTVLDDASSEETKVDYNNQAAAEGLEPAFLAKVHILNHAMKEIGMGRYQYELFFTAGFGWYADNVWLQAVSILQPALAREFVASPYVRHSTTALYAGLIVGAFFFGTSCDVVGRRIAYNSTLLIGGVFGLLAGAAPNFVVFCVFIALAGMGVGGNLPVDGTLFLEFLPGNKQWLLTLLSVWWAIGQVVASLVAWVFLANFSCADPAPGTFCSRASNMGWRYTYFTLGAHMIFLWGIRFLVFPVYESPKFLASIGKDEEAVIVIHKIAKRNGTTSSLTLEHLKAAARPYLLAAGENPDKVEVKFSTMELIKHSVDDFRGKNIRNLFCTKRLAWSTSLVILVWALIGLAYPLFFAFLGSYLTAKVGATGGNLDSTYASYTYQAVCGIPGSILAAALVEWGRGGRKFALSLCTLVSAIFMFGLTQAKTEAQINALTCMVSFWLNAMYGVLFGYSPEVFPTPSRGTGDALAATANRIAGILAPIIGIYSAAAKTPDGPVFTSAAIFVVAGLVTLGFPIETAGHAAL